MVPKLEIALEITLATDEKFEDDITNLIETGKEKGYLTYGDVSEMLPEEMGTSPDDLDDLITTIGTQGIDLLDAPKFGSDKDFELEEGEDVLSSTWTPGTLEKTNDPVRMYLREMGTVPLLTREGEVEIAKRIERGQMRVLKAIFGPSPYIVIREIVALGESSSAACWQRNKWCGLRRGRSSPKMSVQARVRSTVTRIESLLIKHQKKIALFEEIAGRSANSKTSQREQRKKPAGRLHAREGLRLAHCPRAQVHRPRAQTAPRQGQQDGRHHAHIRAPGGLSARSIRNTKPARAKS